MREKKREGGGIFRERGELEVEKINLERCFCSGSVSEGGFSCELRSAAESERRSNVELMQVLLQVFFPKTKETLVSGKHLMTL